MVTHGKKAFSIACSMKHGKHNFTISQDELLKGSNRIFGVSKNCALSLYRSQDIVYLNTNNTIIASLKIAKESEPATQSKLGPKTKFISIQTTQLLQAYK